MEIRAQHYLSGEQAGSQGAGGLEAPLDQMTGSLVLNLTLPLIFWVATHLVSLSIAKRGGAQQWPPTVSGTRTPF